jgi:hypothetical protein
MNDETATRDSFRREPMPEIKEKLQVNRTFSEEEYRHMQKGLIPKDMDDRWFIYFEDDWLFFHRSWTGYCVYQVRLEPCASGWCIAETWVNGDREQFRPQSTKDSEKLLLGVIDHVLLNKDYL